MDPRVPRLMVVDDERDVREPLAAYLRSEGYVVETAANGIEALEKLNHQSVDFVLTDIMMPRMGGMDLLLKIRNKFPKTRIVVFTAYGSVETAVKAIKSGADDYVLKPVIFEEIKQKIVRLIGSTIGEREADRTSGGQPDQSSLDMIVGHSAGVQELKELILRIARAGTYALIQGESGTGKELVARALHGESPRRAKPFIAVNCAAIPEHLLESEFFGHTRGSFTGAVSDKKGIFEAAHEGTLFLDEVGDLPLQMQAKLLRAIETREIVPIGRTDPINVEVTILAASAKQLSLEVESKLFREDLFYRINVIEIIVLPLRERVEDIPTLANHFLAMTQADSKSAALSIADATYSALQTYRWPGNIRELRNVIERAVVLCQTDQIMPHDLPEHIASKIDIDRADSNFKTTMRNFEKELILKTLHSCDDDRKLTAKVLGIGLSSLYRKMEDLGIK